MLKLEHAGLTLPDSREILKDINWEIGEQDNWVLFGTNGAGKTRLLEIISGYRFPSSGSVWRFGNAPGTDDLRETRKQIGYVSTLLREQFSPGEKLINVVLSGYYASIGLFTDPDKHLRDNAEELLAVAGFKGRENDRLGILSDGETQKIIMLRAVISRPEILILDEASKGLDISAREDLLDSISKISSLYKTSIIYVTHHVEEIIPVFKNIFMLDKGECVFSGPVEEGITSERLSSLFGRDITVEKRKGRYYTFL